MCLDSSLLPGPVPDRFSAGAQGGDWRRLSRTVRGRGLGLAGKRPSLVLTPFGSAAASSPSASGAFFLPTPYLPGSFRQSPLQKGRTGLLLWTIYLFPYSLLSSGEKAPVPLLLPCTLFPSARARFPRGVFREFIPLALYSLLPIPLFPIAQSAKARHLACCPIPYSLFSQALPPTLVR